MIEDDLLQLLVHFLLLPEDHITLSLDRRSLELRVLKDVTDDVHRSSHILLERLRVVHRLLPRRICVQMCTEVLHFKFESMLRPTVGALEGHVFQEMRRAVCRVRLCPRACVDPDTDRSSLRMRM